MLQNHSQKTKTESRRVEGKMEGEFSAAFKITPQIRVQWPMWYSKRDKQRGNRGNRENNGNDDDDFKLSDQDKKDFDLLPGSLKTEAGMYKVPINKQCHCATLHSFVTTYFACNWSTMSIFFQR